MSISILEACKKRKRRPKLFGFHSFANPNCPINPSGPFRDNIRLFLQECAVIEDYAIEGMPIWRTLLLHENKNFVVPLYTIEENVEHSPHPFCDHCRCAGWSKHFLSKRKYHLVIPADDNWNRPLNHSVFDLQSHLLHGLIHCNGFGHLICINGIEGGSKFLCGREIMDLWDRICTNLQTRKVTVEDESKKRTMDLRLLHGAAYGHPWFGRWGYKFCNGSFGVMEDNYMKATKILGSIELNDIIHDFRNVDGGREIRQIISYYRDLSETQLITFRDLLRFMLTLKSCVSAQKKSIMAAPSAYASASTSTSLRPCTRISLPNKQLVKGKLIKYKKFSTVVANMDSRWPSRRVEQAAQVVVDALIEKRGENFNGGGMTRQEVRDAARLHIGDTGLLDHVLKSMNNVLIGNYVVLRAINPSTRVLEYSIQDLAHSVHINELEPEVVHKPHQVPDQTPGTEVYNDVICLYNNALLDYPESDLIWLATRAVLDSKHFVKEWPFRDEDDQYLRFICRVMLRTDLGIDLKWECQPGELIIVPPYATIGELRAAVESAMRDTYTNMEDFMVTEIQNMVGITDEEVLFGVVESGSEIWVRGIIGKDLERNLRYQGGADNWTVKCECGARDDDGERMVACDICEVWQHTLCSGIEDTEAVPPLFVCPACSVSVTPQSNESGLLYECSDSEFLQPMSEFGMELTILK